MTKLTDGSQLFCWSTMILMFVKYCPSRSTRKVSLLSKLKMVTKPFRF